MNALGGSIKATRAELAARLEQALGELAAADSLLAAIAELVVVPRPDYGAYLGEHVRVERAFTDLQRDRAISIQVAAGHCDCSYATAEKVLRAGDGDLPYKPLPDEPVRQW